MEGKRIWNGIMVILSAIGAFGILWAMPTIKLSEPMNNGVVLLSMFFVVMLIFLKE